MGFFDYFFSGQKNGDEPEVQFGRFSDAYKEEEKYDAWDNSLALFDDKEYLESYRQFFKYLADDSAGNFHYEDKGDLLSFELYQGSKKITGSSSHSRFQAEAKIAKTNSLHIGFMRKLLEENYHLKYCRYALDRDENLTMVFASDSIDGSPYKLYYALKELATHADKKDDVLISEFDNLEPINTRHIREISENEKRIKYEYCVHEIDRAFDLLNTTKLNVSHYPGAESYMYLDLIYRIDYLIKPEGNIMEMIDKIHDLYFNDKMKTPEQKNRLIRMELKKIREIPYDTFKREIYEVKSTFGVTQPSGMKRIQEFIDSELKNMDWYFQNNHDDFALSIPSYIVGYSLFSYSMPAPMREFFNLYFQIVEPEYFVSLGIQGKYASENSVNASKVKKAIKNIIKIHHNEYPEIKADMRGLLFENKCLFAKSYLLLIKKMSFQRKDHR